MNEMSARKNRIETDSEVISLKMSREKIEFYLNIARENVGKSLSAILIGSLIFAFGLSLHELLIWASEQHRLEAAILGQFDDHIGIWVTRTIFLLIGAYLVCQGVLCLHESRAQSSVMGRALQLCEKESRQVARSTLEQELSDGKSITTT
jgi:hypothetical protein